MLGLYLIAAHFVGDYILQTRWQAARKLTDPAYRLRHVYAYALPFVPIAAWRTWGGPGTAWHAQRGVVFICALVALHYLTDSRRFRSSLGEWLVWRGWLGAPHEKLEPNPWPAMPLMIDQGLHLCQLAVLAGLLLT